MKPLARFATRRPLLILLAWIGIAVGLQAVSAAAGPDMRDTFSLPGSDSQAAYDLLGERFPASAGDTDTIAFAVSAGSITDPAAAAAITTALDEIAAIPSVASITSPLTPQGAAQVSTDGTIAFATVTYDDLAYNLPLADIEKVGEITANANGEAVGDATLTVGHGGQAASRLANPEVGVGEAVGLLIAAVILFFAFGSLLATTVPLISAIVALTAALGALALSSNLSPVSTSAPTSRRAAWTWHRHRLRTFHRQSLSPRTETWRRRRRRSCEGDRNVGPRRCVRRHHRVHRARRHVRTANRVPQQPRHRRRDHRGVLGGRIRHARARATQDVRAPRAQPPRAGSPCGRRWRGIPGWGARLRWLGSWSVARW